MTLTMPVRVQGHFVRSREHHGVRNGFRCVAGVVAIAWWRLKQTSRASRRAMSCCSQCNSLLFIAHNARYVNQIADSTWAVAFSVKGAADSQLMLRMRPVGVRLSSCRLDSMASPTAR